MAKSYAIETAGMKWKRNGNHRMKENGVMKINNGGSNGEIWSGVAQYREVNIEASDTGEMTMWHLLSSVTSYERKRWLSAEMKVMAYQPGVCSWRWR